ncbi:MAG TPA: hypothetical protein VGJ53_11455 [Micromonosporaceae bacterium]|jgi:hypothetical protein
MDEHWWSIEVLDGDFPARRWRDAHGSALVEAVITHGVREWNWVVLRWGVVFEVAFAADADWERFRALPGVQAALDAVPDPVNGRFVYPGRGGGVGARDRRRPGPRPAAGAAELPQEPEPVVVARPNSIFVIG